MFLSMGLREQNKRAREAAILNAARDLFAEHGYDGTSTRAIAERAGVAAGTVFNYATDKRELLLRVFYATIEPAMQHALATLPDGPLVSRLLHICRAFLEVYAEQPRLGRAFVQATLFLEGDAASRYADLNADFARLIAALLADAERPVRADLDPIEFGHTLFGVYGITVVEWLTDPAPKLDDGLATLERRFAILVDGCFAD